MDISLTPDLEQLVNEKVQTGMYQSASEVVREGLELLRERDEDREALRAEIRLGFEAIERGEYTDYDESNIHEFAEGVRARGLQRLNESASPTGNR